MWNQYFYNFYLPKIRVSRAHTIKNEVTFALSQNQMQLTLASFKESTSSLDWIDPYHITDQDKETIWNSRIVNLCQSRKVKNILWTKLHTAKCLIQIFSNLTFWKFMETSTAYRWIIEDSWRWIINWRLMSKCQYASYFYEYITHNSINSNFCNLPD